MLMWPFGVHQRFPLSALTEAINKHPFTYDGRVIETDGFLEFKKKIKNYEVTELSLCTGTLNGNCGIGFLWDWYSWRPEHGHLLKHLISLFEENKYTRVYTGISDQQVRVRELLEQVGFKGIDSFKNKRYGEDGSMCYLMKYDL